VRGACAREVRSYTYIDAVALKWGFLGYFSYWELNSSASIELVCMLFVFVVLSPVVCI
jgi:hypothetical protein